MEEREERVVLDLEDVLLEQSPPREVLGLLDAVPVLGERAEELVEPRVRVRRNVVHVELGRGRLEGDGGRDARDVVDGDHVDRVVDVGDVAELDAALDEAHEEVVRVRDGENRVADDVRWAYDSSRESPTAGLEDKALRDPLGLAVALREPGLARVEVVRLGDSAAALLDDVVRKTDVGSLLDDGGGRDEGDDLGLGRRGEVDDFERREDVGAAQLRVRVDPVDLEQQASASNPSKGRKKAKGAPKRRCER